MNYYIKQGLRILAIVLLSSISLGLFIIAPLYLREGYSSGLIIGFCIIAIMTLWEYITSARDDERERIANAKLAAAKLAMTDARKTYRGNGKGNVEAAFIPPEGWYRIRKVKHGDGAVDYQVDEWTLEFREYKPSYRCIIGKSDSIPTLEEAQLALTQYLAYLEECKARRVVKAETVLSDAGK